MTNIQMSSIVSREVVAWVFLVTVVLLYVAGLVHMRRRSKDQ